MLKIFVSAYACEPEKGSEPGIGWNFINQLSRNNNVHVLTRLNNKESIKLFSNPNINFYYYDLPKYLTFWKNKKRGYKLYYYMWQIGAFIKYKKFINSNNYDLVHHITFGSIIMPSLFMSSKPITVWGPVGYNPVPDSILFSLPFKIFIKEFYRKLIFILISKIDPFLRFTVNNSDWILETKITSSPSFFSSKFKSKIRNFPQTGINTSEPEYLIPEIEKNNHAVIRLIICSELIHWKGVTFSAEIFSRIACRRNNVELVVIGNGPEKNNMYKIFKKYNVLDKVIFKGSLPKSKMLSELSLGDIFLYPSYHHGLATVVLQAMYFKLPVIALHGDSVASTVIECQCGLVATGLTFKKMLLDLENKTEALIEDKFLRSKLGSRGRLMIDQKFEWSKMVERIEIFYSEILNAEN